MGGSIDANTINNKKTEIQRKLIVIFVIVAFSERRITMGKKIIPTLCWRQKYQAVIVFEKNRLYYCNII